MVTNIEVMDKVHELLSKSHATIIAKSERILHSNAIDLDSYENDYLLPKMILYVALRECADSWKPNTPSVREDLKNLEHF